MLSNQKLIELSNLLETVPVEILIEIRDRHISKKFLSDKVIELVNDLKKITWISPKGGMGICRDGTVKNVVVFNEIDISPKLTDIISVARGYNHFVALTKFGNVITWGGEKFGQLEDSPIDHDFVSIDCGISHSVGLRKDGSIVTWGRNSDVDEQFYSGLFSTFYNSKGTFEGKFNDGIGCGRNQRLDSPKEKGFISIACGGHHSVSLHKDGYVVTWGNQDFDDQRKNHPTRSDIVNVVCGLNHTLALCKDGTLVSWGDNTYGQCETPVGNDFIDIAANRHQSLALRQNGTVVSWGSYIKEGNIEKMFSPNITDVIKIQCGYYHAMALQKNGDIYIWGSEGGIERRRPLGTVPHPKNVVQIGTWGVYSVALLDDGTIYSSYGSL